MAQVAATALFAFMGVAGCRFVSTPLSRVIRQPHKYEGLEVTIAGTVASPRWVSQLEASAFCLVEGTDSLLVLTLADPPAAGKQMRLQGRFLRHFPVDGAERMVVLHRTGPEDDRMAGTVDPR